MNKQNALMQGVAAVTLKIRAEEKADALGLALGSLLDQTHAGLLEQSLAALPEALTIDQSARVVPFVIAQINRSSKTRMGFQCRTLRRSAGWQGACLRTLR